MAIPELIKINREEGYYTHDIGRFDGDNQFMAFVVATLPVPILKDWAEHKRWYAVLHTFDAVGNHLQTQTWFAGVTAEGENAVCEKAGVKRDEMVNSLTGVRYCNVSVKLFATVIDGHTFGLVDATEPEDEREEGEHEYVEFLPNEFVFYEPWDGDYDT